jgi:hypothetical protein
MILFGMVDNNVINPVDIQLDKVRDKFVLLGGIDGVYKCRLLAALNKIRIVTRTVREWNQLIKDPPVKINRSNPVDSMNNFS